MKSNPTVEKLTTREVGKKKKTSYSIICNEYSVYEIDHEQLSLLYAIIGEFMEEGKGGRG